MPTLDVVVSCRVKETFRVAQVAGLFDVPLSQRVQETIHAELPDDDATWQLGLIKGPSGSGKSTLAARAFGKALHRSAQWTRDQAVIDHFPHMPMRDVIHLFTAIGFGSPTCWIKPYRVLSGGQRFRCDLARALSHAGTRSAGGKRQLPLVVFDEFTSAVDRRAAKVCAAALAKGIRNGRLPCRFVAVSCHDDVARWLAPDWILDMAHGELDRRRLRRPTLQLEVVRCRPAAWRLFAKHHYLTTSLAPPSRCFLLHWEEQPVAFCATLPLIGRHNRRRITRVVTLPDYQGLGIGSRLMAAVAEAHRKEGHRVSVTTSHPGIIAHCRRSPQWCATQWKRCGGRPASLRYRDYRSSLGRSVVTFEYCPPHKCDVDEVADRPKNAASKGTARGYN